MPEFPDLPWLKVEAAKRRGICEAVGRIEEPFVSIGPERYINEGEQYPYFPSDLGPFELRSVHAVEVCWTASDRAILAAFTRWMDDNRPASDIILEDRGRGRARELLKFLATHRLMHQFRSNWIAANEWVEDHAPKQSGDKKSDRVPRYNDDAAWRKAAAKAERLIKRGIGATPAGMLEGKLKASSLTAVQRARVAVSIKQAKRAERDKETLEAGNALLDRAKRDVMQSAKTKD